MTSAEDEPRHDPKAGHHLDHDHDVPQTAEYFANQVGSPDR